VWFSLSVTWKWTWSLFYGMLHGIWCHEPTPIFLIISQIILNLVCNRGGNLRTVKILIYMKWLELCVYTLLPWVRSSFQIIIYLWGTNKNKYMNDVVNAVGTYCNSNVDPKSSVWLRAACCNSLSQDLSQLPPSHSKVSLRNCPTATNLDFLFHKILVGDSENQDL
jgi:hypothetical protein